jgi:hypothetical protein
MSTVASTRCCENGVRKAAVAVLASRAIDVCWLSPKTIQRIEVFLRATVSPRGFVDTIKTDFRRIESSPQCGEAGFEADGVRGYEQRNQAN